MRYTQHWGKEKGKKKTRWPHLSMKCGCCGGGCRRVGESSVGQAGAELLGIERVRRPGLWRRWDQRCPCQVIWGGIANHHFRLRPAQHLRLKITIDGIWQIVESEALKFQQTLKCANSRGRNWILVPVWSLVISVTWLGTEERLNETWSANA